MITFYEAWYFSHLLQNKQKNPLQMQPQPHVIRKTTSHMTRQSTELYLLVLNYLLASAG
jgi:hypothetical protein